MQRKIIALGAVLVTGMFPAASLAQSTSTNETSDYGTGTVSTQQSSPSTTKSPTVSPSTTTSTSTSTPTSAASPSTQTAPASSKSLAFTGSDVWRGIVAGLALLMAAAFVAVPRRRRNN